MFNKFTYPASDASFADYPDRKSNLGFLAKLFGRLIAWNATNKPLYRLHDSKPLILYENKQTIRLIVSDLPSLKTAIKHVDIHANSARRSHQNGLIDVEYAKTTGMPTDVLTYQQFKEIVR